MSDRLRKKDPEKERAKRNLKRLNEDNVLKLPVKRSKQYMAWDAGPEAARGLGVLISPTGTKSYRVIYYYPGTSKPHAMHLGRVGEMTLADARERARKARTKARDGIDPRGDDVTKSTDFKGAVADYVRHEQVGRKRNATADECERILLKACAAWHERPVATIRVQEIDKLLCVIRDGEDGVKGRPYLANKLHSLLRTFFTWCAAPARGYVKASPMVGIEKPFDKERPRDRVFSDDEIKAIWRAADTLGGSEGRFLKMLMLTGKRKGALAQMRWHEIDDKWFWKPPQSEHRNKRLHAIPLPALAQRVLGPRQSHGYVFPGPVEGICYNGDGVLHRRVRSASGVADFFPHALRHTAETRLAELKVPPHIRDLLFDHQTKRGSGGGYDHYDYGDEMRAAMETWAQHIEGLIQPDDSVRVLR
jgi:integrase